MAENTTSVLRKDPAENITLEDVLYLIQGVGADRDRKMTLEQLRDFIQEKFSRLKITDGNDWDIQVITDSGSDYNGFLTIGINRLGGNAGILLPFTVFIDEVEFEEIIHAKKKATLDIAEVGSFYQKTTSIIKCSSSENPTLPSGETDGRRLLVVNDTSSGQTISYNSAGSIYLNGGDAAEFIKVGSEWYAIRNG